jgi:hypothetical protein
MQQFAETAFYLLVWRAFLVALITVVLMVSRRFEFVVTCLIGANIALLFSLALVAWNSCLDDNRVVRTEAWRLSPPAQRPAGQAGRHWARRTLGELALRFAKGSAMAAIVLSASALLISAG